MVGKMDTKRLDKVESPPTYRVEATVETHDERRRRGGEQQKEEDEYSASSGVKGWQKYHTDAKDRRALKLRKRDISNIFFNQVFLQRGLVIIDADLKLINRKVLKNCHLFSSKIDIYWKLKKLRSGDEIPVDQLIQEDYVEISVKHHGQTVRTADEKKGQQKGIATKRRSRKRTGVLWPLLDKETGKPNLIALTIYLSILICAFIIFMLIL